MAMATGYIPEPFDKADIKFTSNVTPEQQVDLSSEWLKDVYKQAGSSSCVANATAAAFRFLVKKKRDSGETIQTSILEPSRLFIYYNARDLSQEGISDSGTTARNAMKSLRRSGVCSENTWPFVVNDDDSVQNVNARPSDEAYTEAEKVHVLQYSRLDPDYPDDEEPLATEEERNRAGAETLMNLKQCLTEGYPAAIGFNYYWEDPDWKTDPDDGRFVLDSLPEAQRHKPPPRKPNGGSYGGHCVLAIGYDDGRNAVLCQNSWGEAWSNDGKFWIHYDWITDWEATNDFWTLRVVE